MKNIVSRENRSTEWYLERIEYLSRFMLEQRNETLLSVLEHRTRYMSICMENAFHPHNASALIRHCDAFGIQDFHIIDSKCKFRPSTDVVKGTDKWLSLHSHKTTSQAIENFRKNDYRIVATTPHEGDVTPENFDVEAGKFVLVFGTEHMGISDEVIESADEFLQIPMWGFVESLNVSASAAILMYILAEKIRSSDLTWGLEENEKARLHLDWVMRTVRSSEKILMDYEHQNR